MNSALKPLSQAGVPQPGGQASPAKANVATANHAVGLPQGAQNSLHHATNNLVGQNLVHHVPNTPQLPPHAAPSMAPVSANMAQMAQNMSHHGNLSHVNPLVAVSPSKAPTTSAPLSLVQDKANASQPLALTRTPEKKEPDSSSQANGTVESPKPAPNTPASLKPQNPEINKDKQDIAKTSPSTPKPPEKSGNVPSTPQKSEASNPVGQADGPTQPKVATASEAPEKSPSKPTELKPAQTADVAPTQSDNKPVPESANDSQCQEKPALPALQPQKQEPPVTENAKVEVQAKAEEKDEPKVEKPVEEPKEEVKEEKTEPPKEEEKPQKPEEKVEEKKVEPKPVKSDIKVAPKSTLKLATVTPPMRKRRQVSDKSDGATPAKKPSDGEGTPDARSKRNRTKVQLYQSPTPEIAMATKLSASAGRSTPTKQNDDKLIVFYKNEYLAVRNAEGGFYVCQAMQNVYRTTRKIKIRWLSQDKSDSSGETYKPDFYDVTDMECVLTTLSVARAGAGGAQRLAAGERARATSILQRALRAERGEPAPSALVTEEHPDGLDLSLYTDESQLEKKSRKRRASKPSPRTKPAEDADDAVQEAGRAAARRGRAPASKTATAVTEKVKEKEKEKEKEKPKPSPAKRTPTKAAAKAETPVVTPRSGRRAAKERKSTPIVPTPSTSTGKSTRTPRKPPSKK